MPRSPTSRSPQATSAKSGSHLPPRARSADAAATESSPAQPGEGQRLTSLDSLGQAAECLRTLAHPHRLRIVQMLLQGRYMVGELAEACGIASHMASEHLRLMQRCGFLTSSREGRRTYYTIAEPHLANIMGCIEQRFGSNDHAA